MNILKQCFYLLLICFIGEAFALVLPIRFPASIKMCIRDSFTPFDYILPDENCFDKGAF